MIRPGQLPAFVKAQCKTHHSITFHCFCEHQWLLASIEIREDPNSNLLFDKL